MNEVIVASAVRTAIGDFGGALRTMPPCDLGATTVIKAALGAAGQGRRSRPCQPWATSSTEPRDMYLSRVASTPASPRKPRPSTSTACAARACRPSSRQRRPSCWATPDRGGRRRRKHEPRAVHRAGAALGRAHGRQRHAGHDDRRAVRSLRPHAWASPPSVAAKFGISRQDQDALAAESHRRAAAIEAGHFRDQIVPVTLKSRKATSSSTPTSTCAATSRPTAWPA